MHDFDNFNKPLITVKLSEYTYKLYEKSLKILLRILGQFI